MVEREGEGEGGEDGGGVGIVVEVGKKGGKG
jgi:hypothetical protein